MNNKLDLSFFDQELLAILSVTSIIIRTVIFFVLVRAPTSLIPFLFLSSFPRKTCPFAVLRFCYSHSAGRRSVYIKQDKRKSLPKETSSTGALRRTGRKFESMVWKFSYSI